MNSKFFARSYTDNFGGRSGALPKNCKYPAKDKTDQFRATFMTDSFSASISDRLT